MLKTAIGLYIAYILLLVAIIVGWIGNLIHAFHTTGTTDLILTLVGVFAPPLGAIKFFFF
jgi:hypothetical protein